MSKKKRNKKSSSESDKLNKILFATAILNLIEIILEIIKTLIE